MSEHSAQAEATSAKRTRGPRRTVPATGEILTLQGAADLLGVCKVTVRRLAKKGAFPYRRIGKEWRFTRGALLNWINDGRTADDEHSAQPVRNADGHHAA